MHLLRVENHLQEPFLTDQGAREVTMLSCVITARDIPLAEKVFLAEDKAFKHGRSSYDVQRKGDDLIITIKAEDPTALRATVTSVTRILNIVRSAP